MQSDAAMVDITPKPGRHQAGDVGGCRPAAQRLDPMFAAAVVFESGGYEMFFWKVESGVAETVVDATAVLKEVCLDAGKR